MLSKNDILFMLNGAGDGALTRLIVNDGEEEKFGSDVSAYLKSVYELHKRLKTFRFITGTITEVEKRSYYQLTEKRGLWKERMIVPLEEVGETANESLARVMKFLKKENADLILSMCRNAGGSILKGLKRGELYLVKYVDLVNLTPRKHHLKIIRNALTITSSLATLSVATLALLL